MKLLHTLTFALLAVAATLFGACNKGYEPDGPTGGEGKIKLQFGASDLVQHDTRGIATPAENTVNTVDVVFFRGQNKEAITPNSGGAAVGSFHFEATTVGDWVNNDPTTQTVYIPAKASDVNGTTAVTLINLPASVRARLAVGATDEITTVDELTKAVSQTLATVEDLTTPLLMTGQTNVTFANPATQDNKIDVNVKRAVSRLDVVLYYDWDKLIPNQQRGLYTFLQFPSKTFVGANAASTVRRPKWPTSPHSPRRSPPPTPCPHRSSPRSTSTSTTSRPRPLPPIPPPTCCLSSPPFSATATRSTASSPRPPEVTSALHLSRATTKSSSPAKSNATAAMSSTPTW